MKTLLPVFALSLMLTVKAQEHPVEIRFMKNIEFFGYLIELGDPSDNDPNHPISKHIHQYPENSTNEALFDIFTAAAHMDYTTLIHLMCYLPELPLDPNYQLPVQRARELGFESAEDTNRIRTLVKMINSFYAESRFENIWADLEPYRGEKLAQLTAIKPSDGFMKEIEKFYGLSFDQYEVVPSLTLWSGPGWGVTNSERKKATFILGPLKKNYVFNDDSFHTLAIHEFGHSFANPAVLQHRAQLEKTESLFLPVESEMIPQGYSDWETCMIEHFVRAGEVIVLAQLGNPDKSEQLLKEYRDLRKFIYLDFVVERLRDYRLERKQDYRESVRATLTDLGKAYLKE